MQINIVKIGNSRGIRIPKPMLEQAGIADAVEMTVDAGRIVLTAANAPSRADWGARLDALIAKTGEDNDLADWRTAPNDFDADEWSWPAYLSGEDR